MKSLEVERFLEQCEMISWETTAFKIRAVEVF